MVDKRKFKLTHLRGKVCTTVKDESMRNGLHDDIQTEYHCYKQLHLLFRTIPFNNI